MLPTRADIALRRGEPWSWRCCAPLPETRTVKYIPSECDSTRRNEGPAIRSGPAQRLSKACITINTRNALWHARQQIDHISFVLECQYNKLAPFAAAVEPLTAAGSAIRDLLASIDRLLSDAAGVIAAPSVTEEAVPSLLSLNRHLQQISEFLCETTAAIRPRLDAKRGEMADPMYDYEIAANLSYVLRHDDPDYDGDQDNILAHRQENFKSERGDASRLDHFIGPPSGLPGMHHEPYGGLFRDLCEHPYGPEQVALSLPDCLRIGKIFIDVQIWQQYCFDVQSGKWEKP